MNLYLAGPMRGVPLFNFQAFRSAAERLRAAGHVVWSPAEQDEHIDGFNPETDSPRSLAEYMERDLPAVCRSEAVAALPGWAQSQGAQLEVAVAGALGKPILDAETLQPVTPEDILDEAARITRDDRQATYGPPDQDFARTAAMWSALKGVSFEAREVALFMIALKLSRETHQRKRDNWVDIAGYARCGSLCGGAV